jgi:hypothetical protein
MPFPLKGRPDVENERVGWILDGNSLCTHSVRQAVATSTALQDEVNDQRHNDQNGYLYAGALQDGAWTTLCIPTAALPVIPISSIHAGLYRNLE